MNPFTRTVSPLGAAPMLNRFQPVGAYSGGPPSAPQLPSQGQGNPLAGLSPEALMAILKEIKAGQNPAAPQDPAAVAGMPAMTPGLASPGGGAAPGMQGISPELMMMLARGLFGAF